MMSVDSRKGVWHIVGGVARLVVGLLFVISAAAKMVAIDGFEVYIFTYGFLPLELCYLLARLCIFAEAAVGLSLLLGWWPRMSVAFAALMTLGFTAFLCYAALSGRTDSCQCMGNLAHFSPIQSIVKNAVLLVLLVVAGCGCFTPRKPRWFVATPVLAALLVAIFILSVPDNWRYHDSHEPYNAELLTQTMHTIGSNTSGGERRVVAFVTTGCSYCRYATEKLLAIQHRHHLDSVAFVFVAPVALPPTADDLTTESNFNYHLNRIPAIDFVEITYGQRPLVLLLEGDEVVATYHLRNINERYIARWLRGASS